MPDSPQPVPRHSTSPKTPASSPPLTADVKPSPSSKATSPTASPSLPNSWHNAQVIFNLLIANCNTDMTNHSPNEMLLYQIENFGKNFMQFNRRKIILYLIQSVDAEKVMHVKTHGIFIDRNFFV